MYFADSDSTDPSRAMGGSTSPVMPDLLTEGSALGPEWRVMDIDALREFGARSGGATDAADELQELEVGVLVPGDGFTAFVGRGAVPRVAADVVTWSLMLSDTLGLEITLIRHQAEDGGGRSDPATAEDCVQDPPDGEHQKQLGSDAGDDVDRPDGGWALEQVGLRHEGTSNAETLRDLRLEAAILTPGARTTIRHPGAGVMLSFETALKAETDLELQKKVDVFDDLVRIAEASGSDLDYLQGQWTASLGLHLRRTRQLWDGEMVAWIEGVSGVETTTPDAPAVVVVPADSFEFANLQVPVPTLLHRHPRMVCGPERSSSAHPPASPADSGTGDRDGAPTIAARSSYRWRVTAPEGEALCTWAPDRLAVGGDDDLEAFLGGLRDG